MSDLEKGQVECANCTSTDIVGECEICNDHLCLECVKHSTICDGCIKPDVENWEDEEDGE